MTSANRPDGLESEGLAYYPYYLDPSSPVGKVVMFGGNAFGGVQTDKTWIPEVDSPSLPSYRWTLIEKGDAYTMSCPPADGYGYPSPRSSPGLAFDGKEVVLFGGNPITSDTWFLVPNVGTYCWKIKDGVGAPSPARFKFRMAFHPFSATAPYGGEVVLFGGQTGGGGSLLNDTWFFTPTGGWFKCGSTGHEDHPCAGQRSRPGAARASRSGSTSRPLQVAPTMHVDRVVPRYRAQGTGYQVGAAVRILYANGSPVSGASVTVRIDYPDGSDVTLTRPTGTQGIAVVARGAQDTGTYTFTVLDVSKTGPVYNPAQNVETTDSVTIP